MSRRVAREVIDSWRTLTEKPETSSTSGDEERGEWRSGTKSVATGGRVSRNVGGGQQVRPRSVFPLKEQLGGNRVPREDQLIGEG